MANDVDLPTGPATLNVKDFGAVGDGVSDDSQSFIFAIGNASLYRHLDHVVIYIPPGEI